MHGTLLPPFIVVVGLFDDDADWSNSRLRISFTLLLPLLVLLALVKLEEEGRMEVGLAKYCPIIISFPPFSLGMMLLPPPPPLPSTLLLLLLFEVERSAINSNAAKLSPPPPFPLLLSEESEVDINLLRNNASSTRT